MDKVESFLAEVAEMEKVAEPRIYDRINAVPRMRAALQEISTASRNPKEWVQYVTDDDDTADAIPAQVIHDILTRHLGDTSSNEEKPK